MKAEELKEMYMKFYETKDHKRIPSAPLIPENDPSVLFTTAGMHPLVPFLMGEPHPLGKRIVDVQKSLRTGDIDEVGDSFHHTFFEMLGNWSFGDYFKKETLEWSYEFLTSKKWLGLDVKRLSVSCFEGDENAPKDEFSYKTWKGLGIPEERIVFLPKSENWWGPAGDTGPCGPDSEMFYWKLNDRPAPERFDPEDNNWVEIWNDVFMEFNKTKEGKYEPLAQQNVDTGLGVERVAAVLQGLDDNYLTELFLPILKKIEELSGKKYENEIKSFRIVADHMRSAVFVLGDERGVSPSNVDQGYILRRFIRRTIRHGKLLGVDKDFCKEIAELIIGMYKVSYPILEEKKAFILDEFEKEETKFRLTLEKGLKEFNKISTAMLSHNQTKISGRSAFLLFQSYGFPIEMTQELAVEKGMEVDLKGYDKAFKKHQELSRMGAENKFKGGLSDNDENTVRLHTATHLLNEALSKVLEADIRQKGSNITPKRLRFDFNFDRKLTDVEKKAVEDEVNKVIAKGLDVSREEMTPEEAKKKGAKAEFGAKYPPKVSVYIIGDYSLEICMGPHVKNTKEIGHFRIIKEQSSAAGIRRIKAVVE